MVRNTYIAISIAIFINCAGNITVKEIKTPIREDVTIIEGYVMDQNVNPIPHCHIYTIPQIVETTTDSSGKFSLKSPDFQDGSYTIYARHRPNSESPKFKDNSTSVKVIRNMLHTLEQAIYLDPIRKTYIGSLTAWKVIKGYNSIRELPESINLWTDYNASEPYSTIKDEIIWLRIYPDVPDPDSDSKIEKTVLDITTENEILKGWYSRDSLHIEKSESGMYSIALKGVFKGLKGEVPVTLKMKITYETLIENGNLLYYKTEEITLPQGGGINKPVDGS